MPVRNRRLDDSLTLTQSAVFEIIKPLSASNSLTLLSEVSQSQGIAGIYHGIILTQEVSIGNYTNIEIEDVLELTQEATASGTLNHSAGSILALGQIAFTPIPVSLAGNALTLSQSVEVAQPKPGSAESSITLVSTATIVKTSSEALTSYIQLEQSAVTLAGSAIQTASNHLELSHTVSTPAYEAVHSILQLSSSVVVWSGNSYAENTLVLEQVIVANLVANRAVEVSLNLTQSASEFIVSINTWSNTPELVARSTTTFTFPYVSPTTTLNLRNPQFDNAENDRYQRINRQLRGGQREVFRDNAWPSERRIKMNFRLLTKAQRVGLLKFVEDSLGQEVGLLDHESRQWRGIILTPSTQIAEASYGGPCEAGHEATVEFQGELV